MHYCRVFIFSSNKFWWSKMFPNWLRFEDLIACLRNFSFSWSWYILDPFGGVNDFQASSTTSLKLGCENQNASKRNGLLTVTSHLDHYNKMGQWSEPAYGRMEAWTSPPMWIALFVMRNQSNLEPVFYEPRLLLVHVKMSLDVWRSINWFWWMKSLRLLLSSSSLKRPPDFSSREVMIVKSSPQIQKGKHLLALSSERVSSRSNFFYSSCGYTHWKDVHGYLFQWGGRWIVWRNGRHESHVGRVLKDSI